MAVTVTSIAERLSLSPSTVSRSLRHSSRVNPETRAKVVEMAMEMGYQGKGLREEKSDRRYRVAVLPQSRQFRSSVNTVRLLEGITLGADANNVGLDLGLGLDPDQSTGRALPASIADGSCDLALLLGRHHPDAIGAIRRRCPVISVDWAYAGLSCDIVRTDDVSGQAALTNHVLSQGHRRVAWIGEAYVASFHDRRLAGMLQACFGQGIDAAGLPRLGVDAFDDEGHLLADRLRALVDDGVTCLVCVTDRVAFEAMALMNQWGQSVPGDISVTGYDAMQAGQSLQGWPRLTSVDPGFVQIGRSAVELAVRRLNDPAAHAVSVSPVPQVIEGDTCTPPV